MDWEECCNKMIAKEVKPDIHMAQSLIKSSKNKFESANRLEISEITAASRLSLAYDSLRELLEALSLKKGYKIYNHECYTYFIKEVLMESDRGDEFDEIRRVRNSLNYYGKDISVEESEKIIERIKKLRIYTLNLLGR